MFQQYSWESIWSIQVYGRADFMELFPIIPILTTSLWTPISTRELGKQLQLSLVSPNEPHAVGEDKEGTLQCLRYLHIAVWHRYGLHMSGKTTNLTLMSCIALVFPVCTLCLDNAHGDGWVMSVVWRMVASQKTSSMVSSHWGRTTGRPNLRYKDVL